MSLEQIQEQLAQIESLPDDQQLAVLKDVIAALEALVS